MADYLSIVNYNSGLCLAVAYGTMQPGQPVIQWPCTAGNDQMWNISTYVTVGNYALAQASGGDQLQIQNLKDPNYCLSVNDSNEGSQLVVQPCSAGAKTRWNIDSPNSGIFLDPEFPYLAQTLTSDMSGMVAAVAAGSTAANTGIIQWQNQITGPNTHKEQKWLFSPKTITYPIYAPNVSIRNDGNEASFGGQVHFSINGDFSVSGGEITAYDTSGKSLNFNVSCTVNGSEVGEIFLPGWPSWSGSMGGNIFQDPTASLTDSGNSSVVQQSWRQILAGSGWAYTTWCATASGGQGPYPCLGETNCTLNIWH
jgi:hypothetical protein